ncbi:RNA-directed DNA polymerase from mobile element jockey [Eumeta japonica]|uniref:RNA-directed DNA polymerase from mobile element jockey n=1 Tax=Eumeta variegata TaxID=151549 RepID=A0A4C1TQL2_EUMVA|nr:RNA-directed DNA polymerase from mobile element jockey [Eumeta japonica]
MGKEEKNPLWAVHAPGHTVHQSRSSEVPDYRLLGGSSLRCQSPSGGDNRIPRRSIHPESTSQPPPQIYKNTTHMWRTVWRSLWTLPLPPLPGDLFITPAALHKLVMRFSKKKASEPDNISTAALRHLPRRAIVAMNRVFNGILRPGHFPEEWKRGKIITIPKAGKDPRKQENIRPITLLSHVAKTFERALLTKLRLFLTPRQEQYWFRSGHSTTLQLIRILHHLASVRNCERYTVAVLLDKEKAFDRVWHDGLIHKLLDTSLPPALTKVIASFLQHRSFCVAVDDVLSAPRPIRAGVPQGSCLSPELYALYMDDIPTLRGHLEDWEDDVMLALYADDSAYFASSRRADLAAKRIQRVFDLLPEWLENGGWPSITARWPLY